MTICTHSASPPLGVALLPATRRRALAISMIDGVMHAVMLGVTENYLGALALELGHSVTHQALLTTLPILAGATSQLATPALTHWFGGRKRFVVGCATLQALSHLWFISIATNETSAFMPLLFAKVLYYIGGSSMMPAWSSWMASLTEGGGRERFFALRSGAVQAVLLAAFAVGAVWLDRTADHHFLLETYSNLFWVGLFARGVGAGLLAGQHDPDVHLAEPTRRRLRLRRTLAKSDFRVAVYLAFLAFGANMAVPFYVPFWLQDLHLSYKEYSLLVGISVLFKALTVPTLYRVAARFSMERVLYVSGFAVAVLPGAWAIAGSLAVYLAIQAASGIAWGAVEYAGFQLLLKDAKTEVRLEFLSLAGTLSGLGGVGGALLGSVMLEGAGFTYLGLFWASAVARGLPLFMLALLARRQRTV